MHAHQACKLTGEQMPREKPPRRTSTSDKVLWSELPEALVMCIVRFRFKGSDFRIQEIVPVPRCSTRSSIPATTRRLYLRRRRAELFFRDRKTALGLDVLRGESPDMVGKGRLDAGARL